MTSTFQINKSRDRPISFRKNTSKGITYLNMKQKTIKLGNNKEENLHDFGFGDKFLDITLRA